MLAARQTGAAARGWCAVAAAAAPRGGRPLRRWCADAAAAVAPAAAAAASTAPPPPAPAPAPATTHRNHSGSARAASTRLPDPAAAPAAALPRLPKKKIALVVAYDGSYFIGSQYNPGRVSVDGVLVDALLRLQLVDPHLAREFDSLLWSRSSRTDRGVHATCNVVTVKVRAAAEVYDDTRHAAAIVASLNAVLPRYMRVLSAVHVPASFSAHHDAVSRVYDYYLPRAALGGADVAALNAVLAGYVGTHSFHNFTLPRVRAEHVRPRDANLWQQLGIHPSSGIQPPRPGDASPSPSPPPAAEDGTFSHTASLHDNAFTRLYDVLYGTAALAHGALDGIDVARYRSAAAWKWDLACTRTVYSFASAPVVLAGGVPAVRLTVHASSYMLHQIRFMVGTALAVLHGHLPPDTIAAALALPVAPRLPCAPPWGLVQSDVHWGAGSYITLRQPAGVRDDAVPVVSAPQREARLTDARHLDPLAAATQSPSIALLRDASAAARAAFFADVLEPRLAAFCADADDGPAPAGAPPSPGPAGAALPAPTASHPRSADADADVAAPATVSCAPATTPLSPMEYTARWWLRARLPAECAPRDVTAAMTRWAADLAVETARLEGDRAAAFRAHQASVVTRLWEREKKPPPVALTAPVHLAPPPHGCDPKAARLTAFRLAEVRKLLLPNATATAIALATGVTCHVTLAHVVRALTWRIAQAEWPALADAAQHGAWVAATGVDRLAAEGKLLYWMERAEVRAASAHEHFMRRAAAAGRSVPPAVEWRGAPPPLAPLAQLYDDRAPPSRGGTCADPALAVEEHAHRRERAALAREVARRAAGGAAQEQLK